MFIFMTSRTTYNAIWALLHPTRLQPPVGFCPKLQSGIVGLKTYWEWMNDLICGVLFRQKQKKIKIKILVQNVSNYIILHVMYDLYFTKAR